jgi:RimJ/RimL family protein N-acetyltransferase
MIAIAPTQPSDWPQIWQIIEPVFRAGETYPYSPDISEIEARKQWLEIPTATYVARNERNDIVATYYIKPNQPTLGAHVCNCGYIVSAQARGRGIASRLFNLVVSTNEAAVHLWQKLGFAVVGTLPGAFNHAKFGFVDALILYKQLERRSVDHCGNEYVAIDLPL